MYVRNITCLHDRGNEGETQEVLKVSLQFNTLHVKMVLRRGDKRKSLQEKQLEQ